MKGNYEIGRYLAISTAHLTWKDDELLRHVLAPNPIVFDKGTVGWWVYVPEPQLAHDYLADVGKAGFSPTFLDMLRLAIKLKVQWIMLDGDAPKVEGLADWSKE